MSSDTMSAVRRVIINTARAPSAIGPYNQAVVVGSTMYISGQIGMRPGTSSLVEGGVEAQARQALANMGEILRAAGATHRNVVKATVLLASMDDFVTVNGVYSEFFKAPTEPARAAYQVAGLPKGAKVEIEAIAVLGDIVDVETKDMSSL